MAGTAALILARNPDLSYLEVKNLILDNVDPLPDLEGKVATGGRLNVFKALSETPLPVSAVGFASTPDSEIIALSKTKSQRTTPLHAIDASTIRLAADAFYAQLALESESQRLGKVFLRRGHCKR